MDILFSRELDRSLRDSVNVASSVLSKANQGTKPFVDVAFRRQLSWMDLGYFFPLFPLHLCHIYQHQ